MSPKPPKLPGNAVDRVNTTFHYLWGKKGTPDREKGAMELNRDVRDTLVPQDIRQEMAKILRSTSVLGLSAGGLSEASLKIRENAFLVTTKGISFHLLAEDNLVLANDERESILDISLIPNYWDWHLRIYQANDKTNTVLLGHPAAVMAVTSEDYLPDKKLLPDAAELIGQIRICDPDPASISNEAVDGKIIIIPGKGVFSLGETLIESVTNLDLVNRWCEIAHLSRK
ncbi:MAG: class II aldolase/adducin family protein [Chloroflexi bacterium]|nr:class II aldolase/adducin family protein [Chloroflexota bacterium]